MLMIEAEFQEEENYDRPKIVKYHEIDDKIFVQDNNDAVLRLMAWLSIKEVKSWLNMNNYKIINKEPPKTEVEWLDRVQQNFKEV